MTIRMASGTTSAGIMGVGVYRPKRVVTNEDVLEHLDSSDEWIRQRSGIVTRRFANADETVAMMSVAAGERALARADIDARQIGAVIVASTTVMRQTPHVAPEVAFQIGAVGAAAFDVSAGCAGFIHALTIANDAVRAGSAKYVLVVGVERFSDITDPEDRGTAFLVGDGAGAMVVGPAKEPGMGPVVWGSDGSQADVLRQSMEWSEIREAYESGYPKYRWPGLRMEGRKVFRWASFEMAKAAKQALEMAGTSVHDLDVFIPHQANIRITEALTKTLEIPDHVKVAYDITSSGNTGAASVPLAMERMLVDGEARSGDIALLIGFGAGLSYAATVTKVP